MYPHGTTIGDILTLRRLVTASRSIDDMVLRSDASLVNSPRRTAFTISAHSSATLVTSRHMGRVAAVNALYLTHVRRSEVRNASIGRPLFHYLKTKSLGAKSKNYVNRTRPEPSL